MLSHFWRKKVKAYLLNDLRGIAVVLLGTCIYLLLFSAFGYSGTSLADPERSHAFPRKLWQTWKSDAANFDEKMAQRVRSWTKENPGLRYEVLTDSNALSYVSDTFGPNGFNRPDIVRTYQDLTATIVKADFLRYLVMYAEGGIYADVDVEAMVPFDDWVPHHFQEQDLDMIVGVETDEPDFKDHQLLGVKAQSFCQWTFACKRRSPAMLRLINNIIRWLDDTKKAQGRDFKDLTFDFNAILNGTGPSAFTAAVLAEISVSIGRTIDWDEFHRLRDAKVMNRILVLPAQAFAASTGHSDSGNHNSMGALVRHHFGASGWTENHQRYKHPAYGSVEKCNWDTECVKLWDVNTALFNALSEQEQLIFLAELQKSEETPPAEANEAAPMLETSQNVETSETNSDQDKSRSHDGQQADSAEKMDSEQDFGLGIEDNSPAKLDDQLHDKNAGKGNPNAEAGVFPNDMNDDYVRHDISDVTTFENLMKQEQYDIADAVKLERMLMDDP